MSAQNVVIVTKEENALITQTMSLDELAPCSHEEADTIIFVHAKQADILVIAVGILPTLQEIGLQQLWIAFGHGRNLKWIPVHDLCLSIGMEKSKGILFFHAFTGCDVVSAFRGEGKKTAGQTWEVCDEASDLFSKLSQYPPTVVYDDELKILEKCVVMMYDRSSVAEGVNDARFDMFAWKQRAYKAIPPTQAALLQHLKRAAYQAGIWSQSTVLQPEIQSPLEWGWTKEEDNWQIFWTKLPPIAESCQQLTKCGCKSECSGRCKCYRFGLPCTALCSCRCQE
ncbi:hypothetical protein JOQ06_023241 [Pogonophryne albipinna]|uniref:Tesmin/TSO1-like CXC domain-containing protein n=1 Tax=Pogonophryne albipinna TaxID=1090488 RepID=A0AAD6FSM2_9TELE|nr:hypothetical protein JOQ06_023241 [Pogonophryne albipinna]